MDAGFTYERACKQFWLVDKDGLLGTSRKSTYLFVPLIHSLIPLFFFSDVFRTAALCAQRPRRRHQDPRGATYLTVHYRVLCDEQVLSVWQTIEKVKPTILLGLSGVGGQFTESIVKAMTKNCDVRVCTYTPDLDALSAQSSSPCRTLRQTQSAPPSRRTSGPMAAPSLHRARRLTRVL